MSETEVRYEVVPDERFRELEEKLKAVSARAEASSTELRDTRSHLASFTGAGLNYQKHHGQVLVFLHGRPFYLSGSEAKTLITSLQGVLDGLDDRFFTDYGESSATTPR